MKAGEKALDAQRRSEEAEGCSRKIEESCKSVKELFEKSPKNFLNDKSLQMACKILQNVELSWKSLQKALISTKSLRKL